MSGSSSPAHPSGSGTPSMSSISSIFPCSPMAFNLFLSILCCNLATLAARLAAASSRRFGGIAACAEIVFSGSPDARLNAFTINWSALEAELATEPGSPPGASAPPLRLLASAMVTVQHVSGVSAARVAARDGHERCTGESLAVVVVGLGMEVLTLEVCGAGAAFARR